MGLAHHLHRNGVRSIGRISRTRRSISPSSSMMVAGICTAARPERSLTSSLAPDRRDGERVVQRDRAVAGPLRDGEQPGLRARARMRVDGLAVGDGEALRRQRLQPDIVDAAAMAPSILAVEKLLEGGEQDALKLDGQRQQPVEEGGDRRQSSLMPFASISFRPVADSKRSSEQPSTLPRTSRR
jgi:hypothetical protein